MVILSAIKNAYLCLSNSRYAWLVRISTLAVEHPNRSDIARVVMPSRRATRNAMSLCCDPVRPEPLNSSFLLTPASAATLSIISSSFFILLLSKVLIRYPAHPTPCGHTLPTPTLVPMSYESTPPLRYTPR